MRMIKLSDDEIIRLALMTSSLNIKDQIGRCSKCKKEIKFYFYYPRPEYYETIKVSRKIGAIIKGKIICFGCVLKNDNVRR